MEHSRPQYSKLNLAWGKPGSDTGSMERLQRLRCVLFTRVSFCGASFSSDCTPWRDASGGEGSVVYTNLVRFCELDDVRRPTSRPVKTSDRPANPRYFILHPPQWIMVSNVSTTASYLNQRQLTTIAPSIFGTSYHVFFVGACTKRAPLVNHPSTNPESKNLENLRTSTIVFGQRVVRVAERYTALASGQDKVEKDPLCYAGMERTNLGRVSFLSS